MCSILAPFQSGPGDRNPTLLRGRDAQVVPSLLGDLAMAKSRGRTIVNVKYNRNQGRKGKVCLFICRSFRPKVVILDLFDVRSRHRPWLQPIHSLLPYPAPKLLVLKEPIGSALTASLLLRLFPHPSAGLKSLTFLAGPYFSYSNSTFQNFSGVTPHSHAISKSTLNLRQRYPPPLPKSQV